MSRKTPTQERICGRMSVDCPPVASASRHMFAGVKFGDVEVNECRSVAHKLPSEAEISEHIIRKSKCPEKQKK